MDKIADSIKRQNKPRFYLSLLDETRSIATT